MAVPLLGTKCMAVGSALLFAVALQSRPFRPPVQTTVPGKAAITGQEVDPPAILYEVLADKLFERGAQRWRRPNTSCWWVCQEEGCRIRLNRLRDSTTRFCKFPRLIRPPSWSIIFLISRKKLRPTNRQPTRISIRSTSSLLWSCSRLKSPKIRLCVVSLSRR